MGNSFYERNDIKNKIEIAIQIAMYDADETNWQALLDAKSRLYEQFGIEE